MRHAPLALCLLLAACANQGNDESKETDSPPDETDAVGSDDTGDTGGLPEVTWPSAPKDVQFRNTTYLSSFDIPDLVSGEPTCCRDWGSLSRNGSKTDNVLAVLQATLGAFLDLESELDATVEYGAFTALLEHRDLPESGTGAYTLGFFLAQFDPDTTYASASVGDGWFFVDPESFVPGTGRPVVQFPRAQVTDGHLSASGGNFVIPLAFGVTNLDVPVKDVAIEADLLRSSKGVTMTDGRLSGYVRITDFFDAYNDLVASQCGCAGLPGPLFRRQNGKWEGACMDNAEVVAACPFTPSLCTGLIGKTANDAYPGFCSLMGSTLPGLADIDIDGDPSTYEALSMGLRFVGVPAKVVGVLEEGTP